MEIFFQKNNKNESDLFRRIEHACEGLFYISETDAPVVAFSGLAANGVTGEMILHQSGANAEGPVEEIAFDEFFRRLTAEKEWHGEREVVRTRQYLELQRLLEDNLTQRKVFITGKVQRQIFAVGIDKDGCLMGVTTRAVET